MNDHLISALTKKRSELIGKISYYKQEIKSLNDSLIHIDKTIKIFDPDIKLSSKGKAHREYNKQFKHGELSKIILDVLREGEEPLLIGNIVNEIKARKGLNGKDRNLKGTVIRRLKCYVDKGIVVSFNGTSNEKKWGIS